MQVNTQLKDNLMAPLPKAQTKTKQNQHSSAQEQAFSPDLNAQADSTNPISAVLKSRGAIYGSFNSNAHTAQRLKETLKEGDAYNDLTLAEREALDMICSKLARAVNGAYCEDTYVDIAGYATLAIEAQQLP